MTQTETENIVMRLAAEQLGIKESELSLETRLDSIFEDSLEYIDFTLKLGELGHLSEEAISRAETLGDLANAIVHTN